MYLKFEGKYVEKSDTSGSMYQTINIALLSLKLYWSKQESTVSYLIMARNMRQTNFINYFCIK